MIIVQFSRVEICGVDTSKIKVLNEAEKIELLKKIRENDVVSCGNDIITVTA